MLIRRSGPASSRSRLGGSAILCLLSALLAVCAGFALRGDDARQDSQQPIVLGHQIVVLLDVNPNQKKVLPVEQTLAEGVVKKLDQPGSVFSIITFGAQPPTLLTSRVRAEGAIAVIRDIRLGQPGQGYLSVRLYDALNLAFGQFTDDARPKSLLIIAEGNDYPHGKMFTQTVSKAQQLHVACSVAMVAEHTLYGSKSIQRYGFYLRRLAQKTHGRYVEVGDSQKKVPYSADRFSDSILGEYRR